MVNTFKYLLLTCLVIHLSSCARSKLKGKESSSPYIILKLDDLWYEDGLVHPGWQEVFDFLNKEGVIGTLGIVGESLEEGNNEYFQWIKERHQEGHEIWHHGFCHCKPIVDGDEKREYRGTSYSYQLESLQKTQRLAQEKLGLTLHSFGAPYNATDSLTTKAIKEIPALKVWMYNTTSTTADKYILKRIPEVNIEYPVHIPDFEKFRKGYDSFKDEPVLTIQGHPRSWVEDRSRMKAFKNIVKFLKDEKVRFITPYEYYLLQ